MISNSHDQDKRPQRVKSVPRHLNRKSGPIRDYSSSQPELERGRKRETDRQDPNSKPSLPRPKSRLLRGEDKKAPVERLTDIDEISESWQGSERERMEVRLEKDSSAVLGEAHFLKDDYPCSPAGIETAGRDLIQAFKSTSLKIHKREEALETKKKEFKSLRMTNDQLTNNKNKEFEKKMLTERAAWEQEHGDRMKRIQQDHQSGKKTMVESHKREKEHLEKELEERHREKMGMIERTTKEEMAKMKTDLESQILRAQDSLRLSTEQYEKRLKVADQRHREEKWRMLNSFNTEKTQMANGFHVEKAKLLESQEQRMTTEHQVVKDEMMKKFEEEKASIKKDLQQYHNDHFHEKLRIMQDQHNQDERLRRHSGNGPVFLNGVTPVVHPSYITSVPQMLYLTSEGTEAPPSTFLPSQKTTVETN
ncbi:hypothetical protein V8E54_009672 [Elaphomyces granulatus]